MADAKISALPSATTPLAGTEKAVIVQGGVTKQVDVAELGATLPIDLTTDVTGTLPVANGGTGVTTSTGTGSVVLSTSPTLTTPVLGAATGTSLDVSSFVETDHLRFATSDVRASSGFIRLAQFDRDMIAIRNQGDTADLVALSQWHQGGGVHEVVLGVGQVAVTPFDRVALWCKNSGQIRAVVDGIDAWLVNSSGMQIKTTGTLTVKPTTAVADGNPRCKIYSDIANVQTTDATATSIYTWTPTDEATTMVTVEVAACVSTGSAGATYVRRCRIKRDGGTVTVGSVTDVVTDEDGFNGDVTIDNSGTTARVRVTGVAATTADWGCVVTRLEVTHA